MDLSVMNAELSELHELAGALGSVLSRAGLMLATAESCTGGWIAQCVTDIPGSSGWFDRGFVTYSNQSKVELLGVDARLIDEFGAVSEPAVRAMAAGALGRSKAQVAVAVSGVAGPGGGSSDKPVGTVWLAWQRTGLQPFSRCVHFAGDRRAVRQQAVASALRGLLEICVR